MPRLKVKYVNYVARGHYWGINPLAAEALHIKCPRNTILIDKNRMGESLVLKHERHEYSLLKKVKSKKKKLTGKDYQTAHRKAVSDGYYY